MDEKQPLLYLFVALTASVSLAVTIAYLEIQRNAEVAELRREIVTLVEYVEILKSKLNRTESFTRRIDDILKLVSKKTPAAEGTTSYVDEDEDDYYDESYDYDYDDTKVQNSTSRKKRSIDDNGGRIHNILHLRRQPLYKPNQERPEVMAKIFISENEEDAGSQTKPTYSFHTGPKPDIIRHPDSKYNKFGDGVDCSSCGKPVLAHFGGDAAAIHRERHYGGNHRMYHPEGLFREWKQADWIRDVDMDAQVHVSRGLIKVTDAPGIYFFYSQIFYDDPHDSSGYKVLVNDQRVLQCHTTSLNKSHDKWNSCYTGGLIKLRTNDVITIKEIMEGRRYTIFEKTKSFFGLFRVAKISDDS